MFTKFKFLYWNYYENELKFDDYHRIGGIWG